MKDHRGGAEYHIFNNNPTRKRDFTQYYTPPQIQEGLYGHVEFSPQSTRRPGFSSLGAQAPPHMWLNRRMFARKVRIEYEENGRRLPCPIKWLDNFSMRNFTNATVFDDTLPVADGLMEIGANVPLDELTKAMEDWFKRRNYIPKVSLLRIVE